MNAPVRISIVVCLTLICLACTPSTEQAPFSISELNESLGKGINLGNALEAPTEGAWGVVIQDAYFPAIKTAGFESVRIPIRWSAHADTLPPYSLDPNFLARVTHVVDKALEQELTVVFNMHHYNDLFMDPEAHQERFLGIWQQIATHFRDYPPQLIFEPLNEPHFELTPERWNEWIPRIIPSIRETDPRRPLVFGTANWGGIWKLPDLLVPPLAENIIVTIHYYEPFHFTHQGAPWQEGSEEWLGKTWVAEGAQDSTLQAHFDMIKAWGDSTGRPIYIGEFGAYERVAQADRENWTRAVREASEARGFSWAYWEFCSGFGAYDPEADVWRGWLLKTLIPEN